MNSWQSARFELSAHLPQKWENLGPCPCLGVEGASSQQQISMPTLRTRVSKQASEGKVQCRRRLVSRLWLVTLGTSLRRAGGGWDGPPNE